MIETFVDFAAGGNIQSATTNANEMVKRNENAGWHMIQSQLIESNNEYVYSMVYQRTKETVVGNYTDQEKIEINRE